MLGSNSKAMKILSHGNKSNLPCGMKKNWNSLTIVLVSKCLDEQTVRAVSIHTED